MNLNFLEYLGIIMIIFSICIIAVVFYYVIKSSIYSWKKLHRNKCPFCGAYLHGYQYSREGAKIKARYCSRCGKLLDDTKNNFYQIKFRKECRASLLFDSEYRERMKKFGCEGCELFGNDCDGVSGNCDCGNIKENTR